MPHYATLSNIPSTHDNKIQTGHAVKEVVHIEIAKFNISFIIFAIMLMASNFIVLGLSTPLFVAISESIETTDKGKPKLLILMITISFFGTMIALLSVDGKIKTFSAPLSGCYCCSRSKCC